MLLSLQKVLITFAFCLGYHLRHIFSFRNVARYADVKVRQKKEQIQAPWKPDAVLMVRI